MKTGTVLRIIFQVSMLAVLLVGCQNRPQAASGSTGQDQPTETAAPLPSATPLTPAPLPTDAPSPTTPPTETLIPEEPTPALSPEVAAGSTSDLVGVWRGYWSDINYVYSEIKENGSMRTFFFEDRNDPTKAIALSDVTVENGIMTIANRGSSRVSNEETKCVENPSATYEVYITRRGDQSERLRFVLVGDDSCTDRKSYLDGRTLIRFEP